MPGKEEVGASGQAISFPPFRLDLVNEQLWRGTKLLAVRPKTFAVLRYLAQHPNRLVTREELCQAVWPQTVGSDRAPKQCIRELRDVLGDRIEAPRFIETIARRGWRFIARVDSSQQSVDSNGEPSAVRRPTRGVKTSQPPFRLSPPSGGNPHSTTTVLVGREPELTHLHRLLEKAMNGERQVVFVTGEPGIGKSTLVEAFLHSLANHGLWIGHDQCIEQHGAGEAFLPVLDALGRLARGTEGVKLIEILCTYAPMWLVQLPALIAGEEVEALQRKVQGASRERMLRELAEALERLTTEQPLILVLEDLHWSDVSTLDLLAFLARRKEPARLLVIGTYRPVEMLNDGYPLQGITQELYAHRLATELPLRALGEADIAAYLAVRLQIPSPLQGNGAQLSHYVFAILGKAQPMGRRAFMAWHLAAGTLTGWGSQ